MQITTQQQADKYANNLATELRTRFASYKDIITCLRGLLTDRRIIEILN